MSGVEMGVVKKIWETVADRGARGEIRGIRDSLQDQFAGMESRQNARFDRQDRRLETFRTELQGQITATREEATANRKELQGQIAATKDELQGQITATRGELHAQISSVREEATTNRRELQGQIGAVEQKVGAVQQEVAALKGEVTVTRDVLLAAIQGLDRGP